MLKLNHRERGILVAALTEMSIKWGNDASAARQSSEPGSVSKSIRLGKDSTDANALCARFLEEQS